MKNVFFFFFATDGIFTLDGTARVCVIHVDEDRYVRYIKDTSGDLQCATRVASNAGLQGAGGEFKEAEDGTNGNNTNNNDDNNKTGSGDDDENKDETNNLNNNNNGKLDSTCIS